MNSNDCPPWIDPGNAFRVVVKCEKYSANLDYGVVPMCEQEHEIWFDRRSAYSLDKFINDMAAKIIWGRGQTLLVWGVDSDSCSEWKLTGNDQFKVMVQARWAERVVHLCVEVVDRDVNVAVGTAGSNAMVGSSGHGASAVTDADLMGDTCSSPDNVEPAYGDVDWSTLTIVPDAKTDGYMLALVDEDEVFEAMGFKAADDKVEEAVAEPYAIPVIPTELQDDMREAGIPVDDIDPDEPIWDWDRDNPDMSVGTLYPCMTDLRLAVRQHAIVHEFELGTEKSDRTRFRGFCKADGCPWVKWTHACSPSFGWAQLDVPFGLWPFYWRDKGELDLVHATVTEGNWACATSSYLHYACRGLESAVKEVFPWAEQRECFKHLMENMKKRFTGNVYGKYMWPAARAYNPNKYKALMDKVLSASPELETWLNKEHNLLWARSKFSEHIKCDYINNNLAECWNSWIKPFKDLPMHCMADAIREKLVVLFEKRRRISKALNGTILPAVIHQLNAASKGLGHLRVTKGHPDQAEVSVIYKDEEIRRHVVYLDKRICTCREWEITGKPCSHALAVLTTVRQPNLEPYVDKVYSVQSFQAAYEGVIPNITDRNQWPEVDKGFKLLPPIAKKRGVGRQRKNRFLGALERSGKATRQVRCEGCGEQGHRRGSWKCQLTGTKKRKKSKKSKAKPGRKKAKHDSPLTEPATTTGRKKAKQVRTPTEPATTTPTKKAKQDSTPTEPATTTPRTRATAAREAAAAREAEAANMLTPRKRATPATEAVAEPYTRRRLTLEAPPEDQLPLSLPPLVKKLTPRKKQLATKIKKTPKKK